MSDLSKFILNIIENHISDLDFSEFEDYTDFNADALAEAIEKLILTRSLRFEPLVSLSTTCDRCQRPFGNWVSDSGHQVTPYFLEQKNKKIIILDDF